MTEQNIFDNKHITSNSEQISVLKKHFPNCFDKDGKFLIDSFKDILKSDKVDMSHEGYKLDWLGKSYARLLANERPRTFIRPNKEHNAKEQNKNSNNILVKGDNIEVLKHLQNAYTEAVKVIYIDPPYNTGSDGFVYKDDRKFTKEELANLANVSEEDAKRILDFTDKGSNSHSAWLTFIYPRLYVARELLREDGVIFISIDDNEQAQLKLLCDEVFGEENFVIEITWRKTDNQSNIGQVARVKEYILGYAKNNNVLNINKVPLSSKAIKEYGYEDEKGKFRRGILLDKTRGRHIYDVQTKTGKVLSGPWMIKKDELEKFDNENLIYWTSSGDEQPYKKIYLEASKGQIVNDFWGTEFGSNQQASLEVKKLMNKRVFDFPKSVKLLKNLLTLGATKSSLILDFFAGSGTTAHAVMELNAEDGGNRQYILVQLPEETDKKSEAYKSGYNTIFDIAKARIEKAAEKIKAENPDYEGDLGFKIFETLPFPDNYNAEIDKLSPETQTKIWNGSDADESLLEAILTSWTLYDRILLTTDLIPIMFGDYKAFYGIGKESNTLYLMYKGFHIDYIKQIIEKLDNDKNFLPKKIVIYGHNFDSKSQRELNEAVHSFRNKKQVEIDIIKRY